MINDERYIEHRETYRGYNLRVDFLSGGYRCGYVINRKKPISDSQADNINVHGGITWIDSDFPFEKVNFERQVLGFDCAHGGDTKDWYKVLQYFGHDKEKYDYAVNKLLSNYYYKTRYGDDNTFEIKSLNYVIEQCRVLIDQLIELEVKE